jgi:uncharacterized protein (DUF486 family)
MPVVAKTIALLVCSNLFMYLLQAPANRIGHTELLPGAAELCSFLLRPST